MSKIVSIVYQPLDMGYEGKHSDDFIRVAAETAVLVEGYGIEGDRKGGHSPSRQINILTTDWLAARAADGYTRTGPGEFGEQLILDGVRMNELVPGMRVGLGETAVVEITKTRTPCERLEAAQGQPNRFPFAGMLAKVITSGPIRVGDTVRLLVTV